MADLVRGSRFSFWGPIFTTSGKFFFSFINLGPLYQLILFFHPQTLTEMQRNTCPSAHDGPFRAHDPETSAPASLYPAGKVSCYVLHVRDFWH